MPRSGKDSEQMPTPPPEKLRFPRLLTLAQVKEILNVGMPTLYALLSSGELRGMQLGGRRYLAQPIGSMQCFAGIQGQRV
jgi:excisionase family DNA binding protein